MGKLVERKLLDVTGRGVTVWNDDKWALDASNIKLTGRVKIRLDEFEDVELDTKTNILSLKMKAK